MSPTVKASTGTPFPLSKASQNPVCRQPNSETTVIGQLISINNYYLLSYRVSETSTIMCEETDFRFRRPTCDVETTVRIIWLWYDLQAQTGSDPVAIPPCERLISDNDASSEISHRPVSTPLNYMRARPLCATCLLPYRLIASPSYLAPFLSDVCFICFHPSISL